MDTSSFAEQVYMEGTVSSVLFQNDENGYTVLRLSIDSEEITVVGCIPQIAPGEYLTVEGVWEEHHTYGTQLKAETSNRESPTDDDAIYAFLASGTIKGIGAVTAKRLIDTFGSNVLWVIECEPERLTQIRGITQKRAEVMSHALRSHLSMRRLLEFLANYQLPLQSAITLYRRFGDDSLTEISKNPYILTDVSIGLNFSTADELAHSMDITNEDPLRIKAGLLFELSYNLENGHVFLPQQKLISATANLLKLDETLLNHTLESLIASSEIILSEIAGETACYLPTLYDHECIVSNLLSQMALEELHCTLDVDVILAQDELSSDLVYAPLQREAVKLSATKQIMLLTGGPGTGKTTTIQAILSLFEQMGMDTLLAAPTGRAAKRLSETCQGAEASTIHRLLETRFDVENNELRFARNQHSPLHCDAIIVDELSMVDLSLMHALLSALPKHCRLILVGDPNQLPSVGAGNVLADLLRSNTIPSIELTEVFRQASLSSIVRYAHTVNAGKQPEMTNDSAEDVFFLRRLDPTAVKDTVVSLCQERLPQKMGIPSSQIQVLSPTRRGVAGTVSLNQALQTALNPSKYVTNEPQANVPSFRMGDKIMQIKNNYDLMWQDAKGITFGMGIYNGDIGQIISIEQNSGIVTVNFDGRIAEYPPELLHELEHAYAMTVHKSQGSEYRAVILCLSDSPSILLTRSVLYTAITRAKELLIIVGDDSAISQMVKNDRPTRRYSGLRARLVRAQNEANS